MIDIPHDGPNGERYQWRYKTIHDLNMWNVFIWKFLLTCLFDEGVPYLHLPTVDMSSRMHGNLLSNEGHVVNLMLATSIYIGIHLLRFAAKCIFQLLGLQ